MDSSKAVLEYLKSQQALMTELLKDLVRMESPSTDPASQTQIRARLRDEFEALDYRVLLIPGRSSGGQVYVTPKQRERNSPVQLMMGHCDTVWPVGTLDNMPLICEDNIVRGPGVYDMKAGLVEMIFALKAIRALKLTPSVAPILFINSDEEIGSRESTRYVRALAQCVDRVMVMEPSLG
ncbi:MAG: M20/M25/M40 family metallo-hydrolase, partial [Arenicellales bacterium]